MSEPYTPLMAELREAYQLSDDGLDFKSAFARRGAEFDRALAAHDESVRAEARAEAEANLRKIEAWGDRQYDRAEKAEAERDELAAVIEKVHAHMDKSWAGGFSDDKIALDEILSATPADLLAERDKRVRFEALRDRELDEERRAERIRAERFPAPHDTEAN